MASTSAGTPIRSHLSGTPQLQTSPPQKISLGTAASAVLADVAGACLGGTTVADRSERRGRSDLRARVGHQRQSATTSAVMTPREVDSGWPAVSSAQKRTGRQKADLPANWAVDPSSSSIRMSWLYFSTRSPRQGAPDFRCPVSRATVRSEMKLSTVSPER